MPVASDARCAAASMPRASPETTAKPASPSSRAIRWVNLTPAPEALREPTMATSGSANTAAWPRMAIKRRRVVDHLQRQRIIGFAQRHESDAELLRGRDFALGLGARINLLVALAPPRRASDGSASSAARAPPK